ncbi:MAG: Gldg family protein [Opitutales bacterium]
MSQEIDKSADDSKIETPKARRSAREPGVSRFDDFSFSRRFDAFNRLAQIVLALTLFLSLNYLAATHFDRFDLTQDNRYSLTPQTRAHIQQLKDEVIIYGLIPKDDVRLEQAYDDVEDLLREYAFASRAEGEQTIRYQLLDYYQQYAQVQTLFRQYGIDPPERLDSIQARPAALVVGKFGHRLLLVGDMYNMVPDPASRELVMTAFRGEEAVTLSMIDVSGSKRFLIYFIQNHQESQLNGTSTEGLSVLRSYLEKGFYDVRPLDLLTAPAIPTDADMVVLPGPRSNLRDYEVQKLRRYLNEENGRLMVFLGPWRNVETERADGPLRELLREWGVQVDNMLVFDFEENAIFNDQEFLVADFSPHPSTQFLNEHRLRVHSGFYRPVRKVEGQAMDSRVTVTTLMRSSRNAYAELSYRRESPDLRINYDEGVDLPGPVSLAALSERNAGTLKIPGGRLMVFGAPGLIENRYFNINAGNQILVSKSFAWMLDREEALNLEPREPLRFNLSVTDDEWSTLGMRMLALPAAGALLGLFVFALRRR